MILILECLVDERSVFCNRCKKCNECRKLVYLIEIFTKIDMEVRQTPRTFVKMVKFNKSKSKLELYYAKTYTSYAEAKKTMLIFFLLNLCANGIGKNIIIINVSSSFL